MKFIVSLIALMLVATWAFPQGIKSFTLKNGLTVYVWEDASQADVFGMVAVRAGSYNDPQNYTGLAHYLEHVMFKGTERISSLDWEKEKPIYEKIIQKYDERAATTDPAKRLEIDKEINELTVEQSKLSVSNEFNTLVESIGGVGLNAGTSFDKTVYYNSFPPNQIEKWLELYSARFMNPVFRTFQSELETVYEEFNMYQDSRMENENNFMFSQIFTGSPYERPIIGKGEHLKNPQLSELIKFYNTWYVPNNMALILVGNIKTEEVASLINRKFGRLTASAEIPSANLSMEPFVGRKEVNFKNSQTPSLILAYNGVSNSDDKKLVLDVCCELLSNSNRTGLLDKLTVDGDVMYAAASPINFSNGGRVLVQAVPAYDVSQRRFESHKNVEKYVSNQFEKLLKGEFEDWLFESVKLNMARNWNLALESGSSKASILSEVFISGEPLENVISHLDQLMAVTKEDVMAIAQSTFTKNLLAIYATEGSALKTEKMKKPEYIKPVESSLAGEKSLYNNWFTQIEASDATVEFTDLAKMHITKVNERSQLYYYPNSENNVFVLTIKYGVGERDLPKIGLATSLMNSAGIMAAFEPQEFRKELGRLASTCTYFSDDDYTYVRIIGLDENLQAVCNLVTRQILMPKLDIKQLNNVKGQAYRSRILEKSDVNSLESALFEYMKYQQKSSYIDRISETDLIALSIADLTRAFQDATDYAADIHYSGSLSFDEAYEILSANLPLKAVEKETNSPKNKDFAKYSEGKVFLMPNNETSQSKIYFFGHGPQLNTDVVPNVRAFNQYFSGSFGGLVMNEIREKNSMAYTAQGVFQNQGILNDPYYFLGFIGTQADKTIQAIDLFMGLVNEMPENPARLTNIKMVLKQGLQSSRPTFRNVTMSYQSWLQQGYTDDPAKTILPQLDAMTFDNILDFYRTQLKAKPLVIGIVGDVKQFDVKALEKYGKVERVSNNKLFN